MRASSLPKLNRNLRRVVFGRPTGSASSAGGGVEEVVLSVHGGAGDQLGYAALRLGTGGGSWGGLSLSTGLGLPDVRVLAWRTELQLAAVGIERGSHHCALSVAPDADAGARAARAVEFARAMQPLFEDGLCEVVFTHDATLEPPVVAAAFRRCAVSATLAAVEHAGLERRRATVAIHQPARSGDDVVRALTSYGLTPVSYERAPLSTAADVLLLDGNPRSMTISDAHAVRARVIVALTPTLPSAAAMRRLSDRRITLVPDTVIGAGRFLALDLCRRGLGLEAAVRRAGAVADEHIHRLLGVCGEASSTLTPAPIQPSV
jgi:hypothetical protein